MSTSEEESYSSSFDYSEESDCSFDDVYHEFIICKTCDTEICKVKTFCNTGSKGKKVHSCIMCPHCRSFYCSLKHMKPKIKHGLDTYVKLLCEDYLETCNECGDDNSDEEDRLLFQVDNGPYQISCFNDFGREFERMYKCDLHIEPKNDHYVYDLSGECISCVNCRNK